MESLQYCQDKRNKEEELPIIDEFAKDVSEFDTLEEYKKIWKIKLLRGRE